MIKDIVNYEMKIVKDFNYLGAPKRISDKIWKILRALDVQPVVLPRLHKELCDVYLQGLEETINTNVDAKLICSWRMDVDAVVSDYS